MSQALRQKICTVLRNSSKIAVLLQPPLRVCCHSGRRLISTAQLLGTIYLFVLNGLQIFHQKCNPLLRLLLDALFIRCQRV
jgi:hypothetical protein